MGVLYLATLTETEVVAFGVAILSSVVILLVSFWAGNRILNQPPSPSPYSGRPLRRAIDLSYFEKERILGFLFSRREYHNRIFDIDKAAFCRETGRIFPNAITWYNAVVVDWSFLEKRYPGQWVSWGSLTELQQAAIREAHHKIEGYQMELSSPDPNPRNIAKEYAYAIPGPLYVDLETSTLLGWKMIPESEFEVLVVQKPKGIFETPNR